MRRRNSSRFVVNKRHYYWQCVLNSLQNKHLIKNSRHAQAVFSAIGIKERYKARLNQLTRIRIVRCKNPKAVPEENCPHSMQMDKGFGSVIYQ